MTALAELFDRPTRLRIYLVAFLGGVLLGSLLAGYAAVMHDVPRWLVFVTAAWLSLSGAVTPALALGNLGPSTDREG